MISSCPQTVTTKPGGKHTSVGLFLTYSLKVYAYKATPGRTSSHSNLSPAQGNGRHSPLCPPLLAHSFMLFLVFTVQGLCSKDANSGRGYEWTAWALLLHKPLGQYVRVDSINRRKMEEGKSLQSYSLVGSTMNCLTCTQCSFRLSISQCMGGSSTSF